MNRLPLKNRAQILGMLVEGTSLRAASRLADVSINTVSKLLVDIGNACLFYQDENLRGLRSQSIQVDEIWAFCRAKEKNVPTEHKGKFGWGDVWTWVAIDAHTKLVPCWLIAGRDADAAAILMRDLASRLQGRVQLTTDGHRAYLTAVEEAFGADVDYSQLIKLYGPAPEPDTRYSPGECVGCKREHIVGNPDPLLISTSYVERQNLTMRMSMRWFTRLTNAFSKKVENHAAAVAIHFMHYNFARIHKTLRITPAMAAGVSDHMWGLEEIADLAK
ncbi:MAG TPA: DDE-type integrase/transposase/recombinase [Acidobacteriota bacterium]